MTDSVFHLSTQARYLNVATWSAQALVSVSFCIGGFMKTLMPVEKLSQILPWTGQVSRAFLRFIGLVDFPGGVGIILPTMTGVMPRLTVAAASGCMLLQLLAIQFHVRRGELRETPVNFVLLALCALVAWGRWEPLAGWHVPSSLHMSA